MSAKKIGTFRIILAIFGALVLAYLSVSLLMLLIPGKREETVIISVLFNTLAWAALALWISLSSSKLIALLRTLIPIIILCIIIIILY